nr:MAG TPA: tail protein [Caudoviricetes sp.]
MICLFNSTASKSDLIQTNGDYILDMLCTSAIITEELNGEYSFDGVFRISDTFPKALYDMLTEESILKVSEEYGEEYFRIAKVIKSPRNITVFARHITISDILTLWCEDVRPENQNGAGAISWIYNNSIGNKLLTVNSDITETNTSYFINKNVYECLFTADNSFLDRWGGEVYRRGLNLSINKRVGADRGVTIRSKKNLTGFEATTSVDTLITRIYPKGYDGITINEKYIDSKYINNYARIYSKEVKFDDIKVNGESIDDGFETLAAAQEELKNRVKQMYEVDKVDLLTATYRINFVELGKTEEYKNYSILEKTWLGDTVEVIEDTLGINISVRVLKRKFDVLKNKRIETELSNKDIKEKPPTIQQIANEIEKIPTTDTFLQMAKDQATSVINAGINGYVVANKNEILIMDTSDKNTATKVWRFNVNGIGYSNTGYYGEYGTAITMEGQIVADFITTGILNAGLIKTGILQSFNGKTWINMEDGTFNLADSLRFIDGKLSLIHSNGEEGVTLDNGGIKLTTYSSTNGMEEVAKLIATSFSKNHDQNGLSICTTGYGDYIQIGYEEDGTIRAAAYFVPVSIPSGAGLPYTKAGTYFCEPVYIKSTGTDHEIKNLSKNFLGIYGDNGVAIGFKSGDTLKTRLQIYENSPEGTGDHIESYGNWNFKGWTLHNLHIDNYTLANTYANLSTNTMAEVSPLETDYKDNIRYIYKNITSVNNKIILNIPNEYAGREYTIVGIVKKGFGDYAITSEEETRFIIETDREMTLNIEVSIV